MALKRLKTKKSKRITGKLKHKIEKKVQNHNRKIKREKKKSPTKSKKFFVQIPNACPYKESILKEAVVAKNRKEEERRKRHDAVNSEITYNDGDLNTLNYDVIGKYKTSHENDTDKNQSKCKPGFKEDQSLKKYFKEFKKVLEIADIVLEVVDARDPLGTRCLEVERAVRSSQGNKKLVLILNKADLVPKENLNAWLKYFRRFGPVTAFKASTQDQNTKLGRRKFNQMNSEKALQSSICVGAELLMSMLGNYCRNKGIKTSICVGVVGIPNVGKSSIINSLTRGKSCSAGCTPGVTRVMQQVELDAKIKLIDCPGIVFPTFGSNDNTPAILKNVQRVGDVMDPFAIAEGVLKRASKEYFCKLYDISEYDTFEEFFAKKAARMGKFLKKGIPDVFTAARSVLNDWNTGKIKYCTHPPEFVENSNIHVSATIVHEECSDYDAPNLQSIKLGNVNNFDLNKDMEVTFTEHGEYNANNEHDDKVEESSTIINESDTCIKGKKRKLGNSTDQNPKMDPVMELVGNLTLNKNIKEQFKKKKKRDARNEKKVEKVSNILNSFNLTTSKDDIKYD